MLRLRLTFLALSLGFFAAIACGAEKLPPAPAAFFNDYANVVSASDARVLDLRLAQFERDTSNQILVVVYPRMESSSSVEDYTVRMAQSWGVGQKGRNNGAVLFAFMAERQLRIEVGYGLEGSLPDATCHSIIADVLTPRFRAGDFAGGFDSAITAIIAATRGEYKGSPNASRGDKTQLPPWVVILLFFGFVVVSHFLNRNNRRGTRSIGGSRYGGSSWSSGGGGGGSFGGGGASGRW